MKEKKQKKRITILLLLLICVMAVIVMDIYKTKNARDEVTTVFPNPINAATGTTGVSVGRYGDDVTDSVVANFDENTGAVTISNTRGIAELSSGALRAFLEDCGLTNVKSITFTNEVKLTSTAQDLFANLSEMTHFNNANRLDVSEVTSMYKMFSCCNNLISIDVSNWKVSNVTTFGAMFESCTQLASVDVAEWNIGKTGQLHYMFYNCSSLTSIDVSKWDTKSVKTMQYMFYGCNKLESINVSNWDVSEVTDMGAMFRGCGQLETINVTDWNVGKVTNLSDMFTNCGNLKSVDVSKWNIENVYSLQNIFYGCSSLQELDVSKWNTGKVTTLYGSFYNCRLLKTIDVSDWDVSKVTNMRITFQNCSGLTTLDVSKWDTGSVEILESTFNNCGNLTTLDVSKWNTENVTTMYQTFAGCSGLTELNVSNWNTAKVKNMQSLFLSCNKLITIDVSKWNTSSLENMFATFQSCSSLTSIDLRSWNTEKVTNMSSTFNSCTSLKKLDLRSFDFSNVTEGEGFLSRCTGINEMWLPAYTAKVSIDLPDRYRDTDEPENSSTYYTEINSTTFANPRHIFRGVFIFFDLGRAKDYVLTEQIENTKPQWSIVEEEVNSGGTEGYGKDILPITTNNYSDTISTASILWNEESLENALGYKFVGWQSNHNNDLIGVPYVSSDFSKDITYVASFEAIEVDYTVQHWQQNIGGTSTDTSNYTLKDTDHLRGITDTNVTPAVKNYEGFTAPSMQTVKIAGDGSTVVNYYYTRNQYTVTLTKDEGIDSVSGANTYYYDQDVTINAEVNENYVWANWTGTATLSDIQSTFKMPAQNVELQANSIKKTNVEVYYLDKTNDEIIAETKIIEGYIGKEYDVNPIQIEGYQYSDSSENTTGFMIEEPIKIYFRYLKETGLNVKYVDINTNEEIAEAKHYDAIASEEYDVTEDYQEIERYTFIKDSGNTTGIFINEGTDVIYYYAYNAKLIVKYYDINTNKEIADSETIEGYEGKEYSFEQKEIDGYQFVKIDNAKGKIEREGTEVKYYYAKEVTLTIKYINVKTRQELKERKEYTYITGDTYNLEKELEEIDGYKYIGANVVELQGEIALEDIIIEMYYDLDDTTIEIEIPQAGEGIIIIPILVISIFVSSIMFIKYKKYGI